MPAATFANDSSKHDPSHVRLRGHRIPLAGMPAVQASAHHAVLGPLEGQVLDVSLGGLLMSAHCDSDFELVGSKIEHLKVWCGSDVLYSGGGTVARQRTAKSGSELGIALDDTTLQIAPIARSAFREDLDQRFAIVQHALDSHAHVSPPFRAWSADLAGDLNKLQTFLDKEDALLETRDALSQAEGRAELQATIGTRVVERMNRAGSELGGLIGSLSPEGHGAHRDYLMNHLSRFFKHSPFMHRAYTKPLGYAGDYEMMNMLYRDHAEGLSTFGRALNVYATSLGVARANINRIEYFRQAITHTASRVQGHRVRIASIGCGPAHEILNILQHSPGLGPRLDVTLLDQDHGAIAHCERTLATAAARTGTHIQTIQQGVRVLLSKSRAQAALATYDLIYSAGLFDYLDDRAFAKLLGSLHGCLQPSGELIIGNVAENNPDRWAMEYFTAWHLHHRTPGKLLELGQLAGLAQANVHVDSEQTGINLFLKANR